MTADTKRHDATARQAILDSYSGDGLPRCILYRPEQGGLSVRSDKSLNITAQAVSTAEFCLADLRGTPSNLPTEIPEVSRRGNGGTAVSILRTF